MLTLPGAAGDLVHISILALANQYLDYIARAHSMRLEIAADYLVMAAWLAYLKSRLLLPRQDDEEEPTGPELAAALAFHLQRYNAMKEAGVRLMEAPRREETSFPAVRRRGLRNIRRGVIEVSLFRVAHRLWRSTAACRRSDPAYRSHHGLFYGRRPETSCGDAW